MSDIEKPFVCITTSNAKRLIHSFDLRAYVDSNYSIYTRDLRAILSPREIARIALLQELFKTKGKSSEKSAKIKSSSNPYAFGPKKPAYHQNDSCQFLHSNYLNLEIPVEIKARGENEVEKFKTFCEKHRYLFSNDESRFLLKLEAQFMLQNPPKRIEYENSGVYQDHSTLQSVSSGIEELVENALEFRGRDKETTEKICKYGQETHRCDETGERGSVLNIWHYTYKLELKKQLEEYSRLCFNPANMFDATLLEKLNFKECSGCSTKNTFFLNGETTKFASPVTRL